MLRNNQQQIHQVDLVVHLSLAGCCRLIVLILHGRP